MDALAIPEGIGPRGREAAETILRRLKQIDPDVYTGGCKTFYSPEEWAARGEKYGHASVLVVVYDGGEVRPHFSMDAEDYQLVDAMQAALAEHGLYAEECTCWYAAIYNVMEQS